MACADSEFSLAEWGEGVDVTRKMLYIDQYIIDVYNEQIYK